MVVEFAVRDGDSGGALDHIDEAISSFWQRDVVDPYVVGAIYIDGISIALGSEPDMLRRVPDHSTRGGDYVMDPYIMDNNIVDELDGEAGAEGYMDLDPSAVDGLVAREDELLPQLDDHAVGEDDPKWLRLDHRVAEGPRLGVVHVVVGWVGDHVVSALLAAGGVVAEAAGAVG